MDYNPQVTSLYIVNVIDTVSERVYYTDVFNDIEEVETYVKDMRTISSAIHCVVTECTNTKHPLYNYKYTLKHVKGEVY